MTNSKFTLITTFLFMSSAFTFGQRQKIAVSSFDAIALSTSASVFVTEGDTPSVEVEASTDDFENMTIKVDNNTLEIKNKSNWGWSNHSEVKVYVTMSSLSKLSISGSGNIISKSNFKTNDLEISVSGSGDVEFDIEAAEVVVKISGSGGVELTGNSANVILKISGSGKLDAENMEANTYDIAISGSGKCRINVKEAMDSRISGSGSIYYKGNPNKLNNHSAGSGKVIKI